MNPFSWIVCSVRISAFKVTDWGAVSTDVGENWKGMMSFSSASSLQLLIAKHKTPIYSKLFLWTKQQNQPLPPFWVTAFSVSVFFFQKPPLVLQVRFFFSGRVFFWLFLPLICFCFLEKQEFRFGKNRSEAFCSLVYPAGLLFYFWNLRNKFNFRGFFRRYDRNGPGGRAYLRNFVP